VKNDKLGEKKLRGGGQKPSRHYRQVGGRQQPAHTDRRLRNSGKTREKNSGKKRGPIKKEKGPPLGNKKK